MKTTQPPPPSDKKHPSTDPIATRVENLTEQDLAEMEASPIPEEARAQSAAPEGLAKQTLESEIV